MDKQETIKELRRIWTDAVGYTGNSFGIGEVIAKLQATPVYTKEMHESGELPPVGAKFLDYGCSFVAKSIYVRDGKVYFWNEMHGGIAQSLISNIRPIKTQEEKELIDLIDALDNGGGYGKWHFEDSKQLAEHLQRAGLTVKEAE